MSYEIRARQARCAALGFWPGPINGIDGKRTQAAYAAAVAAQKAKGLPFQHPTGITRIHMHWTGGQHTPNADDRKHYHWIIDGEGRAISCNPNEAHLAHTLNANGGAIGVSMACMASAVERPFNWGTAPMTVVQLHGMAEIVARFCRAYDIPVSRYSTLTHAEVQPTLGMKQRGKWDINVLPGMEGPADPVSTGDRIRQIITAKLQSALAA